MTTYRLANHRSLTLGAEIGRGGEGTIYAVAGSGSLVAKIYHQPSNDAGAKLRAMLARPPVDPTAGSGHASIAWPKELILDDRQQVVGFLMPRIDASRTARLLKLYHPRDRRNAAPSFTWEYLLRTARNLATVVDAVQHLDYVIGDLNESNWLVTDTALVTLVDCDSMQVPDRESGRIFRCGVGKAEYTPPELQGLSFAGVDRRAEHDDFGLAVLIYQLLMEGVHPFTGVWRGAGTPPQIEEHITSGRWAYGGGQLGAPDHALPFATLPPGLRRLFERCFRDGQRRPGLRPTPAEWRDELDRVEGALTQCHQNRQHVYSAHLKRRCPWCERVKAGLPEPFPRPGQVVTVPTQKPLRPASFAQVAATPARPATSVTPPRGAMLRTRPVAPRTPSIGPARAIRPLTVATAIAQRVRLARAAAFTPAVPVPGRAARPGPTAPHHRPAPVSQLSTGRRPTSVQRMVKAIDTVVDRGQSFMAWTVMAAIVVFGFLWYFAEYQLADASETVQGAARLAQHEAGRLVDLGGLMVPASKRPGGEQTYWVRNHRITDMWSGPAGPATSFGKTDAQFCAFLVAEPSDQSRLYVYNPVSRNFFWIDRAAVGRVGPPSVAAIPRPTTMNCADTDFRE